MMMKTAPQATAHSAPREEEDDTLSALLDGELAEELARPTLRHLLASAQQQQRFHEYCAVGDALRGLHGTTQAPDLTQRVMAALEQEPTILAPMRKAQDRRASLWLAAAAVSAITWGLWNSLPDPSTAVAPIAANIPPANVDVQPYLAAHQDFAQAVIAPAEMNFTQVSLVEARP